MSEPVNPYQQQPAGPQPSPRKGWPAWVKWLIAAIVAAVIAIIVFGHTPASTQDSSTGGQAAPPAASPSAPACTSNACIVSEMQQSLTGFVAKDESVATKVTCKASTVKHAAGTWTARCTVTYSDGSKATGFGNLIPAQGKVTFEPVGLSGQ